MLLSHGYSPFVSVLSYYVFIRLSVQSRCLNFSYIYNKLYLFVGCTNYLNRFSHIIFTSIIVALFSIIVYTSAAFIRNTTDGYNMCLLLVDNVVSPTSKVTKGKNSAKGINKDAGKSD